MNRKTLGALLVFLVLLGIVYYLQTRPDKGERRGERPRPVPRLTQKQIKKVAITAKGTTVALERAAGPAGWRVTKPVSDDADSNAAKTMVEKLVALEFSDLVTERKDRHSEHGVDDKGVHVVVSDGKKDVADFYLGKVIDGFTMVRAAGSNQVFQCVGTLSYVFDREAKNWRDRTVVELKQQEIRKLEVTTTGLPGAGSIVLARPDEKSDWKVESSSVPVDRLEKSAVGGLLSGVGNLTAFDFADKIDVKDSGLDAPSLTVTAHTKGGKQVVLLVGNHKGDDYWVQRKGDPQVFVVKKYAVDNLLRRPIDFRDRAVISFKPEEVSALTINKLQDKNKVKLVRRGEDWLGDGKKIEDTSKIKTALATLSTLRAEGFGRYGRAEMGLETPDWQVEVLLKGNARHELSVGSVEKDGFYAVQADGKSEIFTFRKYTLDRFLLDPKAYK